MNFILASTSTVYGSDYLEYLEEEISILFKGVNQLLFIPYARPNGMTHDEYTQKAQSFFSKINISVKGIHEAENPQHAIEQAEAVFTGGGNTFLLVKQMHEKELFAPLKKRIQSGMPYLGTSAGSNIGGVSMKTTNDMPIVYPPSFSTMGIVPFNLNPHYLDPETNSTHKGETRETRILEFLTQNTNPVIGLREGNWIRGKGETLTLEGKHTTRIFENHKKPYEVEPNTDIKELLPYLFQKL